jgi:3-methyladenine DNA glycosylase AlkD
VTRLAATVQAALRAVAQPDRAPAMQAYMKSAMPFLGIEAPLRRRTVAEAAKGRECSDAEALAATLLALWRQATHREERYAALDLLRLPRHRRLVDSAVLPVVTELLQTDPWWDFNDEISGQVLPLVLLREPAVMKPLLLQWARSDDLWLRRAAMLAQRAIKGDEFDAVLLYGCILPSLQGPGAHPLAREFFIRKGMGWALRERSYAAPAEVQAFCAEYGHRLAPLTLREALKVVKKKRPAAA